jgi:hypothetical protein
LWTPADLPRTHQIVLFVLASGPLRPSPSALAISGLYQASGSTVFLVAYVIPCVRFNCLVRRFHASATIATLGTIDWLGLIRQRLSLCKKRQALLGAPTVELSGAADEGRFAGSSTTLRTRPASYLAATAASGGTKGWVAYGAWRAGLSTR